MPIGLADWASRLPAAMGTVAGMTDTGAAILFDIDGTLVDSTYHHALAWHRAFARHDVADPAVADPPHHRDGRRQARRGGRRRRRRGAARATRCATPGARSTSRSRPRSPRCPGAADLVRRLAEQGYRVALASSGETEFAEEALDDLDIRDHVAVLTTSEDVEDSKPEPDLIEVTLEKLGTRRAVLVGDTPYDVESAARAGLRCIGLRSGGFSEAELDEAGAASSSTLPRT